MAYPLSDRPLIIGSGGTQEGVDVRIKGELAGVSRRHCTLERRGEKVLLTDHSTYGTFVDDVKISGTVVLQLGQIVRVGTPGETLQLIASTEKNET
jgi:pSer/pThr/pTyr-binding forkhead associated (FHA) protein